MTLREFKNICRYPVYGGPMKILEIAKQAEEVEDAPGLQRIAQDLRTSFQLMQEQLERLEIPYE